MNSQEAQRILNIGYIIFGIGLIVGSFFNQYGSMLLSALMTAYIFWSMFWGIRIMKKHFYSFFNFQGLHIGVRNIFELLFLNIGLKIILFILFIFVSYVVGVFGGAIFMQIKLSRIAYFHY